jgi:hypothetical protein
MFGDSFLTPEVAFSRSFLTQVLGDYSDSGQHGLIQLRGESVGVDFLIVDGELWSTCRFLDGSAKLEITAQIMGMDWHGASMTFGVLPPLALRAAKICFSIAPALPKVELSLGDFYALMNQCQKENQPGLLWLLCGDDPFFIFIPGHYKEIDHIVDFAAGELVADPVLISALLSPRCASMHAAYFPFSAEVEAWQEYCLHRHFCEVYHAVAHRYTELTGRVMLQLLGRTVSQFASKYSWPVEIRMETVIDGLVLSSSDEYRHAYKRLLACMLQQAASSVGDKVLGFILNDYISSVPAHHRASIVGLLPEMFAFLSPAGES